jgi:hypothetical protein
VALQTFTAGQVLTAAQVTALQTNDFNQTVSTKTANYTFVVGDRGTRVVGNGTSITFTVDNSIFSAGDTIKLHNINSTALTIAAGAGVTINNAAGLTMVQWQEATLFATSASSFILFESTASTGTPMGVLLNTTSFSAVSSFSLAADTFTATYDNYLLMLTVNTNSADAQVLVRVRAAGTDLTGADYNFAYARARSTAAAIPTGGTGGTSLFIGEVESTFNGRAAYKVDFISPKILDRTRFVWQAIDSDQANNYAAGAGGGVVNNALAYDAATVFVSSGTFGGSYSVYGYNK